MKKRFTKLAGGIMAASMILGTVGVAAPVFADPATPATPAGDTSYDISIINKVETKDKGEHKYTAYQILAAKSVSGDTLTDIVWGSAVPNTDNATTATFDDTFAEALLGVFSRAGVTKFTKNGVDTQLTKENIKKASVVAEALALLGNDSEGLRAFAALMKTLPGLTAESDEINTTDANDDGKITVDKAGFYLVEDTNISAAGTKDTYTSEYMLKVAGDVEITTKGDVPTSNKTVTDNESGQEFGEKDITNKNKDTADYNINDQVPFTLYGSVADNYDKYTNAYEYAFVDQFCEGLDAPTREGYEEGKKDINVSVKVGSDWIPVKESATDGWQYVTPTAVQDSTDKVFKITFADLKNLKNTSDAAIKGKITEVRVEYYAKLNDKAKVGTTEGNPNKSHIEYSNNPNGTGTGTSEDTNVKVFTYELEVDKVDGNEKPLAGAGFTLYRVDPTTNTEKAVFVDENNKVVRIAEMTAEEVASKAAEIQLPAGTEFNFIGLDAGQYKLVETTVPDGYNKAADVEFTITATQTPGTGDVAGTDAIVVNNSKVTNTDGSLKTTVMNNTGATLPSTGGIGTTIFYIVGAAAAVTAVVLLTARKRASKED